MEGIFQMLSRRRGLTLVEVLAVVAIIGLLAGLLLPAVQSVRESARSSSCGNNMRQMATAIEAYTNQHGFLPPGGVGRPFHPSLCPTCSQGSPEPPEWQARQTVSIAEACTSTWTNGQGLSWSGHILPFVDHLAMFAKINPLVISHGSIEFGGAGTAHGEGFGSFFPTVFQCPSNPVPVRKDSGWSAGLRNAYVGISGADVDPGYRGSFPQGCRQPGWGPVETTYVQNLRAIQGVGVPVSINGILIPNGKLTPGHVLDGMSNTMVVGEQSDWGISLGGGTEGTISWAAGSQIPCRAGNIGVWSGPPRTFGFRPVNALTNTFVPNVTTITAGLGTRICPDNGGTGHGRTSFAGLPMPETGHSSTPIRSAHRAGAWIAFADGSVRFLAEGIETALFKNLAVRDTVRASPPPLKVLQ